MYAPAGRPATDVTSYDAGKKRKVAVRQEGHTWFKVVIPSGGSDKSIAPGNWLVPSTQQAGSVQALEAISMTTTYVKAEAEADMVNRLQVVGKAHSMIVIPASGASWGGLPSFGGGTMVATLTAITNAETSGFVFGKYGK